MLYNQEFVWLPEIDADGNETIKKNYNSIAVWFWFPEQNKMRPVRVVSCIMEFPKFQRLNIHSHISRWLAFNPKDDEEDFKIPHQFKKGGLLIGAAINDIKPSELAAFRSDTRSAGPIYGDKIFNEHGEDVIKLYQHLKNDIREYPYFFPQFGRDQRAFDCLPKALNQALRGAYFTTREQVVRLIQRNGKMTYEEAQKQKELGGVSPAQLKNLAYFNGRAYSLKHLISFDLRNSKSPGKEIKEYFRSNVYDRNSYQYNELIIVYHGTYHVEFSHAATFAMTKFNKRNKL